MWSNSAAALRSLFVLGPRSILRGKGSRDDGGRGGGRGWRRKICWKSYTLSEGFENPISSGLPSLLLRSFYSGFHWFPPFLLLFDHSSFDPALWSIPWKTVFQRITNSLADVCKTVGEIVQPCERKILSDAGRISAHPRNNYGTVCRSCFIRISL